MSMSINMSPLSQAAAAGGAICFFCCLYACFVIGGWAGVLAATTFFAGNILTALVVYKRTIKIVTLRAEETRLQIEKARAVERTDISKSLQKIEDKIPNLVMLPDRMSRVVMGAMGSLTEEQHRIDDNLNKLNSVIAAVLEVVKRIDDKENLNEAN